MVNENYMQTAQLRQETSWVTSDKQVWMFLSESVGMEISVMSNDINIRECCNCIDSIFVSDQPVFYSNDYIYFSELSKIWFIKKGFAWTNQSSQNREDIDLK